MRTNPILVVDDDDALREALVEALEVLPVEITVAASGAEAVGLLAERRFAVVVTDLVMKGTDGFAVLTAAKGSYPNCRVVMLTGHGGREVAVQAMEQGATYYVEKPVDLSDLRAKVKKSLEDHDKDVAYDDLKGQMERVYGIAGIVGQDPKMQRTLSLVLGKLLHSLLGRSFESWRTIVEHEQKCCGFEQIVNLRIMQQIFKLWTVRTIAQRGVRHLLPPRAA